MQKTFLWYQNEESLPKQDTNPRRSQTKDDQIWVHNKYKINKQSEKESKKTIPLTITSKWIKFLEIKPNQGGERLVHWKVQNITERN